MGNKEEITMDIDSKDTPVKTIKVPFVIGERVRPRVGDEFLVTKMNFDGEQWSYGGLGTGWLDANGLTPIETIIKWKRNEKRGLWYDSLWYAFDDGRLYHGLFRRIGLIGHYIGTFDDPRAVAEATEKMWKDMAK